MRHVSRIHRVALDWFFDRINFDPKIQIKYIHTKNQLADILTKENFTRDEWNHLLCLFNISRFSSTDCLGVMSKRTQEETGEERVTAKSKPMMHLVSRYRVRDPNVLASIASESLVKTRYESVILLSSWTEQQPRTVRLVMDSCSSIYSEWNADENGCSQEWKSGEMLGARTVRPVDDKFVLDDYMDSDTATESDLCLKLRSFLHRVNDRVRKMLDQSSKDATQDSNKHCLIWRTFMSSTLEASVFMRKNYSDNVHSIKNTEKDLTMKQMFDISEKLITEQSDEIYGVNTFNWEDSSWKYFSLVGDEQVISLSHAKVYIKYCFGATIGFKSSSQHRTLHTMEANGIRVEYFPGFTTLQLCNKVQEFMSKMSEKPE